MMAATVPVEKDKKCQQYLLSRYPDTCLFPDILALIRNDIPDDCLLDPRSIRFKQKSFCLAHNQECRLPFGEGVSPENRMCLLGPPCIIFSRQGRFEETR